MFLNDPWVLEHVWISSHTPHKEDFCSNHLNGLFEHVVLLLTDLITPFHRSNIDYQIYYWNLQSIKWIVTNRITNRFFSLYSINKLFFRYLDYTTFRIELGKYYVFALNVAWGFQYSWISYHKPYRVGFYPNDLNASYQHVVLLWPDLTTLSHRSNIDYQICYWNLQLITQFKTIRKLIWMMVLIKNI